MPIKPDSVKVRTSQTPAQPKRFYYLNAETRRQIDEILSHFVRRRFDGNLYAEFSDALAIRKSAPESVRRHVEGVNYAAECLWSIALQRGREAFGQNFDRHALQRSVRTLPISHYHYLIGSREPRDLLLTRRDALHDPQTALAKLRHDLDALVDFLRRLPTTSAEAAASFTPGNG